MTVQIGAPARTSAGEVINPRANEAREQVCGSQLLDWIFRGWVFSVSQGLEATDLATVSTEASTTAMATLQAPAGGDIVVVPLRVWVSDTVDGGGANTLDLAFTQAAAECATALTISGTALNIQNHYTPNPSVTSKATSTRNATVSALLTTDYITLAHHSWPDAPLTTSLIVPDFDYKFNVPLALQYGAALLLYGYTASSAGKMLVSITWAEVPASVYIP